MLADLGLDDVTIAAALLHDAVEDTTVTKDDIERELGADVATIVDGVTKLDRLQFDSKEAQQRPRCARCSWRWPRTSGSC